MAPAAAETLRAGPSRTFVDSVGVNVHPIYLSTPYKDADRMIATLQSLGIRHVRQGIHAHPDPKYAWVNGYSATVTSKLAAAGIKSDLVAGDPDNSSGTVAQQLAAVRDKMRGAAESIEGPNEWDQHGGTTWASSLAAYQRAIYAGVKADPALHALPVIAPALGEWRRLPQLGDLSLFADYGNLHPYAGGLAPGQQWLDDQLTAEKGLTGTKKVMATEAGYHNAMADTSTHKATSERAAGIYTARTLLEHFRRGIPRTWMYELIDENANAALTNKEQHFGLLRLDWSEKPAARGLRNVLSIAGSTPSATSADLTVGLDGAASAAHRVAVRRADGSIVLFLWQDSVVWDKYGQKDLYPSPVSGTLTVAQPFTRAERYSVGASAAPASSAAFSGSMNVTIPAGDIVAIRFSAPSPTASPVATAPSTTAPAAPAAIVPAAAGPAAATPRAPSTRPSRRCRAAVRRAHRARVRHVRARTARRAAQRTCGARAARRLLARAARAAR